MADPAAPGSGGGNPLAELRNHPQFNQLRQLVRDNPAALENALQQIAAQSPPLLEAIRANPAEFLQMHNEPVAAAPAPAPGAGGMPGGMDPAALMQMIAGMSPEQLAQLSQQVRRSSHCPCRAATSACPGTGHFIQLLGLGPRPNFATQSGAVLLFSCVRSGPGL